MESGDLGVSSWQFDTGARGFSTRFDGPLDMRMDVRGEKTAADILQTYSEAELHKMFERWGEVRNARQLAKHIATNRGKARLTDIESLKALIGPVIKGLPQRYLAQVFQALRIEVNEELDVLKEFLEQSPSCLKEGGRLSVISFHSLEDRLVKTFMKRGVWEDEVNEFGRSQIRRNYVR
jgi:16S rRNA (cytosine1402-N4)-methyltransferase